MCELPSCSTNSTPRAQKRHRCCECRGWIEPGETYALCSGIWDGEPDRFKTCLDCDALRAAVDEGIDMEERTAFGMLYQTISERAIPEERARYIAIMVKRGAPIHWTWLRDQHAFPPSLPIL